MDPESQFSQSDGVVRDGQRKFSGAAVDFLQDTFQMNHIITRCACSLAREQLEYEELKEQYH